MLVTGSTYVLRIVDRYTRSKSRTRASVLFALFACVCVCVGIIEWERENEWLPAKRLGNSQLKITQANTHTHATTTYTILHMCDLCNFCIAKTSLCSEIRLCSMQKSGTKTRPTKLCNTGCLICVCRACQLQITAKGQQLLSCHNHPDSWLSHCQYGESTSTKYE